MWGMKPADLNFTGSDWLGGASATPGVFSGAAPSLNYTDAGAFDFSPQGAINPTDMTGGLNVGKLPDDLFGGADKGLFGITGLGKNIQTLGLGLDGLKTLGSMWGAYQTLKLANKQFDFNKQVTNENLGNQIQSYNTAIADKARGRSSYEGTGQAATDKYVADNSLKKVTLG